MQMIVIRIACGWLFVKCFEFRMFFFFLEQNVIYDFHECSKILEFFLKYCISIKLHTIEFIEINYQTLFKKQFFISIHSHIMKDYITHFGNHFQ